MNLTLPLKDNRLCKSLTGLSIAEFKSLCIDFSYNYKEARINAKPDRERKYGGGCKGKLETIEEKLLFILFYMKVYPTFDLIGFMFGMVKSKAHRWQSILQPILEQTLERKLVLPERKVSNVEGLFKKFPEVKDLI